MHVHVECTSKKCALMNCTVYTALLQQLNYGFMAELAHMHVTSCKHVAIIVPVKTSMITGSPVNSRQTRTHIHYECTHVNPHKQTTSDMHTHELFITSQSVLT